MDYQSDNGYFGLSGLSLGGLGKLGGAIASAVESQIAIVGASPGAANPSDSKPPQPARQSGHHVSPHKGVNGSGGSSSGAGLVKSLLGSGFSGPQADPAAKRDALTSFIASLRCVLLRKYEYFLFVTCS
jgi:hypothetical protein